jgi:hypothetical protein
MSIFASRQNSPAEQRALEVLIIETFDAACAASLGGATGIGTAPAGDSTVPAPPENLPLWEDTA